MTAERLGQLNGLYSEWRKLEKLMADFIRIFDQGRTPGEMPTAESDRKAAFYLIGGGNYNPSDETWTKIRALLAEDLEQSRAEAEVEFENA